MNHIRYVEYNARHDGSFVFDVPDGHDCWLLLITHTPAFFRVDGSLREYPAKSAVLFTPRSPIYYCASGSRYENDWMRFDSDEDFVSSLPVQGVPFLCRTQNTAIISFNCSPGKIPFPAEIMNGLWNSFSSFFFPNCRKLPKAAPTPFPNHRIIMI